MKAPHINQAQREKFEQATRELQTDNRKEAFDAALKKVVKAKAGGSQEGFDF